MQKCLFSKIYKHMSRLDDAFLVFEEELMPHNHSCAQAKRPGCECECGGAMHGCQGAFAIAEASNEDVQAYLAQQEKDWTTRPSGVNRKQAAVGCARADVVHWLHRDRELLKRARTAEETAFEDNLGWHWQGLVLRGLTQHLGPQRIQEFQEWARQTHFWCELLAQMAWAVTQYEKLRGQMFRMVEDVLSQRDTLALPEKLRHAEAIGVAAQLAWRYVLASIVAVSGAGTLATLLAGGDVELLVWPIRVIAVLMCPDASRHPAVRRHCWEPIIRHGDAEVRQVVRNRLAEVFPDDPWFPRGGGTPERA
ncbi:hypothetical protein [Spirillospora sp. CA-294931]|uniref:hypothetical protein n=1 Tax=Spirillospora sp. CA-294931 TaxID=3240042 RepID=UPI003D8AF0C6